MPQVFENIGMGANPKIQKVEELLSRTNLAIPIYQRPYKWQGKHVNQLLSDILAHKDKSSYRLGTIVFHREEGQEKLSIVDGQQRIIRLFLVVHALAALPAGKHMCSDLRDRLAAIKNTMTELSFSNEAGAFAVITMGNATC